MNDKIMKCTRIVTMMIALVVCFTMIFVVTPEESYAATKTPAKVVLTSVKSIDHNAIKITWKKAKNAKKYQVYRATSKNGKYKLVKTTTAKSFTNKKLTTGKKYYYKVRAINGSKKGKFSVKKYAIPKLKQTTGVKLTSTEKTVKITFNKVNGAKGYQIYRATSKNGTYKKVKTTSELSFTNKSLTVNKGYYYKVRAYKKVNGKIKYGKFSTVKYIKTQNHDYVSEAIAPTCIDQGYTIHKCTNCGNTYKDAYVAAKGHNYGDYVVTAEPKCDEAGTKEATCAECEGVKSEEVPATGHQWDAGYVHAPKCEEQGYTEYTCTAYNCGHKENREYTEATGHSYSVTKDSSGKYIEACSNCGSEKDHNHDLVAQYREKTDDETKLGYWEYTTVEYYGCQECGGQLITAGEKILTADSDPATLATYQEAHNKFHEPDGVTTPTYGTVVAEESEPAWVSTVENDVVIEGYKCQTEGCDYKESHNHNCTGTVEVATDDYELYSATTDYKDRLDCPRCKEDFSDYVVYDSSNLNSHIKTHITRKEYDRTNGNDLIYDNEVFVNTLRSIMTTANKCETEGCCYVQ